MSTLPSLPAHAAREEARVHLRFEDITQDGRLVLEALPNAIAATVWRRMLRDGALTSAGRERGIVPILSRFVLEGTAGPFSVGAEVTAETASQMAIAGEDRLTLDVVSELFAPLGHTYAAPDAAAAPVLAGRVFAEHTFTKPFAPPGQRRVVRSDLEDCFATATARPASPPPEAMAHLPEGAIPLEPGLRLDGVATTFGLVHTDSNMHVNSLVYLRVCEEAALRRFAELGRGSARLGRRIDIAYRKPLFAGQTARVVEQAFELEGRIGASILLMPQNAGDRDEDILNARPHAYARMLFEP